MKHPFLAAAIAALGLAFGAAGANAFETVTSTPATDTTVSTKLADPSDILDNMNQQQSSSGNQTIQFGGGTLHFGGSSSGSGGTNSPFVSDPQSQFAPLPGR